MPSALTPGDGQDLFARYKQAWEDREPDRAVELFAPDAEVHPDPFGPVLSGANALRAFWNAFAAERTHTEFDAERVWVAGRTVLGSFHAASTVRSTAQRVRVRGFMTLEVDEEGLVTRMRQWSAERVVGVDGTLRPIAAAGSVGEENHG